jgi:hypothetical protein
VLVGQPRKQQEQDSENGHLINIRVNKNGIKDKMTMLKRTGVGVKLIAMTASCGSILTVRFSLMCCGGGRGEIL